MTPAYVNIETCESKHRNVLKLYGLLATIISVLFVLFGWTLLAATDASKAAYGVDAKLETHAARQNGSLETIDARLKGLSDNQEKMYKMVSDLWERQRKGNRE